MKLRYFLIPVLVILLIGLFMMTLNRGKTIRVAVIGDYSTTESTASIDAFRAIEVAQNELLQQGKNYSIKRFNIGDYEDLEDMFNEINDSKTDLVLGPTTSSQYIQCSEILSKLRMPVILTAVSTNIINNKKDNLFRLTDSVDSQVNIIIEEGVAYLQEGPTIVYYTSQNKGYSQPLAKGIAKGIEASLGHTEVIEVMDLEMSHVQEMLLEKKAYTNVVIVAGPSQAGIIAQLVSVNNTGLTIFFPAWAKADRTVEYTTNVENDMYIMSTQEPKNASDYDDFVYEVTVNRNGNINEFAKFGYETMKFLDYIVTNSKNLDFDVLQETIHNLETYEGRFNTFTFDDTGDGSRQLILMEIIDGQYWTVGD